MSFTIGCAKAVGDMRASSAPLHSQSPVLGYFAFGSNMNPNRVQARGLSWQQILGAMLPDVALVFDKRAGDVVGAGHANIRYAPGSRVYGVLYLLTTPAQIARMDPFEHAPINYGREVFYVQTAAGARIPAWTYVGNPAALQTGLLPTRSYMAQLLAGEPWLPPPYVAQLRSQPCLC